MLKVKWVVQGGDIGSEKNLIEIVVLNMIDKSLEEVGVNFFIYNIKFKDSVNNLVKSELIYGFVQFQICIMVIMYFNFLLLYLFLSLCILYIFLGMFLYNFCLELKEQKDFDFFIYELFVKGL